MAKALLIYYSQSGTTAKIAQYIAAGISAQDNWDVDQCNINKQTCPNVQDFDLIGIGSPVYYFNPVPDIRRFLSRLPDLKEKPVFIFLAYGTNPGNAIVRLHKIIAEKGAIDAGAIICRNANFILGYHKSEKPLTLDQVSSEELSVAINFGKKLADQFKQQPK